MARIGTFDKQLVNLVWYDENQVVEGWYTDDLIEKPPAPAGSIKVGANTPATYKVGSSSVDKIYIGSNQVYP